MRRCLMLRWLCSVKALGSSKKRGQDFSGAELDEAAFVAYREHASHGQAPAGAASAAVRGPSDPSITLDFKMASVLLDMFGGEPGLVTLQHGGEKCHSGAGLYAWHSDLPEEGANFLGAEPHHPASAYGIGLDRRHSVPNTRSGYGYGYGDGSTASSGSGAS